MLALTTQDLGDVTLIHCTGRIVAGQDDALRRAVMDAAKLPAVRSIVLDLAEAIVLDAAGLGTLVELHTLTSRAGRQFKLINVPPRIEELLRVTQLAPIFRVCSLPETLDLICRARVASSNAAHEGSETAMAESPAA